MMFAPPRTPPQTPPSTPITPWSKNSSSSSDYTENTQKKPLAKPLLTKPTLTQPLPPFSPPTVAFAPKHPFAPKQPTALGPKGYSMLMWGLPIAVMVLCYGFHRSNTNTNNVFLINGGENNLTFFQGDNSNHIHDQTQQNRGKGDTNGKHIRDQTKDPESGKRQPERGKRGRTEEDEEDDPSHSKRALQQLVPKRVQFWILVIQWPASFCNRKERRPTCKTPIPRRWTIHSLLPVDVNGFVFPAAKGPKRNYFTMSEIRPLVSRMSTQWPQVGYGTDAEFWNLEYAKHGFDTGLSPYDYFEKALDMKSRLDAATAIGGVENLFFNNRIIPGFNYDFDTMCDLITVRAATPEINCNMNQQGIWQIHEIRTCHMDNNELFDCNEAIACYTRDCGPRMFYPAAP